MWIKPAILILLILLLFSLGSGLVFLIKDQGRSKRTLYSLGVRVSLAVTLVAVVAYGFYTGELHSRAPWDAALQGRQASPAPDSGN